MQKPDAILIFAAGFGTRMGALTANRPKPLVEVAGRALIDHALALVDDAGLVRVVANLHYKPDMIRAHLSGRDIQFSDERPDILETGGGLRAALPLLGDGPVMTMNSDAVWKGPNPISMLLEAWRPDEMDALLMCIDPSQAIGHKGNGDFVLDDTGYVQRGPGVVYSGVQIIKPDGLAQIEESSFSLNLLWNRLIAENRLCAITYPGQWCDVGHPAGIKLAEDMLGFGDV